MCVWKRGGGVISSSSSVPPFGCYFLTLKWNSVLYVNAPLHLSEPKCVLVHNYVDEILYLIQIHYKKV